MPGGCAEGGDVDVEEDGEGDLGGAAGIAEGEDVEAEVEAVMGVVVPGGGHGFEGVVFWWGGVVSFWVVIGMLDVGSVLKRREGNRASRNRGDVGDKGGRGHEM